MSKASDPSTGSVISRIIGVVVLIQITVLVILFVAMFILVSKPIEDYYYETTDVANYGDYIGNADNSFPQDFINSFFPEKIRDSFSDVIYSYRAEDFDAYGFEAYLEFTINDAAEFDRYITSIAAEEDWRVFQFDDNYMEYIISDEITLHPRSQDETYNHIEEAEIGKILYSEAEQRIIYIALGVYDGGGVTTEFLSVFFERFDIDPLLYEQTADASHGYDPFEID